MNPYGANQTDLPPLRREDRYRTEIHRRAALPFHHTASPRASHDLLVMNQRPDLAGETGTPDAVSFAGGQPA
jgi:hypothetical protein